MLLLPSMAGAEWSCGAKCAGITAGAGALVLGYETWLRDLAARNRTGFLDDVSQQAEKLGNGGYDAAFVLAWGGAGLALRNGEMTETAWLAGKSFVIANAIGTAGKIVAGRTRPYAADGNMEFRPFSMKTSRTSFPSGHTVSAFSVATVFAERSEGKTVPVVAYGLASAAGLQRIYARKHWLSDVAVAAALGIYVGRSVVGSAKSRTGPQTLFFIPEYSISTASSAFRLVWVF